MHFQTGVTRAASRGGLPGGITQIDGEAIWTAIQAVVDEMPRHRRRLNRSDARFGDGDHGTNITRSFSAVGRALHALDPSERVPETVFLRAAEALRDQSDRTIPPLYAAAFARAAVVARGKTALNAAGAAHLFEAMAHAIATEGKLAVGCKTLLDTWQPAAEGAVMQLVLGADLVSILDTAAGSADWGAANTARMTGCRGDTTGHVDPGAMSAAIVVETFVGALT